LKQSDAWATRVIKKKTSLSRVLGLQSANHLGGKLLQVEERGKKRNTLLRNAPKVAAVQKFSGEHESVGGKKEKRK